MKRLIVLLFFATVATAQQVNVPQPDSLTVEKIADKFVQDHAAEAARCLVLRVQYDQIMDQNQKLITENASLKKQLVELAAKK
jgi:hypothetical protein